MIGTMQEWRPQPEVTDHDGNPAPPNAYYFVPPPLEIGTITSAYSNLAQGANPDPIGRRLGCGALGIGIAGAIAFWITHTMDPATMGISIAVSALIFGAIGFWGGAKVLDCTYVGENGVAKFSWDKDPNKMRLGKVFLFQYASELRTSQTRRYTNGVYNGTSYTFTWTDYQGKQIHSIAGSYSSEKGTPAVGDAFYYARAAEGAWSAFAFERAKAELAQNGAVRFNLTNGNYLVVGQGFIDLAMKGQVARCSTQEIDRISIKQGVVTLRRTDAKSGFFGIGSSGIFSFNYADIGNARLFLVLLDHLVGIDFS